jgi:DNA ligase D-like protein (predicted ligase)
MAKSGRVTRTGMTPIRRKVERPLPPWIAPELCALVKKAPDGPGWLHEIKLDGYRMHARIDQGDVRLLTRSGLDWTHKYPAVAASVGKLRVWRAYLDGELCGVLPDGKTAFNLIQNATDNGEGSLVFFLFDLLFLDGEDLRAVPVLYRKERLAALLSDAPASLQYNNHHLGQGAAVHKLACERGLEGIVSKRADGIYEPGQRSWLKTKCLNREEFVVVGYSDPEGSRHRLGSLLLGYYTPDGRLLYAGRAGTGMPERELERLWQRLQPLAVAEMPLAVPPPRGSRFGSPLVLSRVHWVRPEMVVEVSFVEFTPDGLLRHVVYLGEREDKPAAEVVREEP